MNEHGSITQGLSPRRKAYDITMRTLLYVSAAIICALLVFLIGYILYRGIPSLSWQFLTSEESVIKDIEGILPAILNTVYVIIATLIFILPLGVGSAIYLTEYATNKRLVAVIEFATETLSGMPSIIFALVGVIVFCELFGLGISLIAGAFSLVMMTLPTVIRTTQESLKTVPQSYREGSLALGSGKWHMIRTVVLPSSIDGIVTEGTSQLDTAALKEKVEQVQKYLKDIVSKQGEIKQFLSNVADTVTEFVNKVVDFIRGIFG